METSNNKEISTNKEIPNNEVNKVSNKLNSNFEKLFHNSKNVDYIIEDKDVNIGQNKVVIPQIIGMLNVDKQKAVNSTIEKNILEKIKYYIGEDVKGDFFTFKYTNEFKSEKLLSFLFECEFNTKGAAHPARFGFSINVNLDKNNMFNKNDIIVIDEDIAELFINKKFVGKNEISQAYYSTYFKYVDNVNKEHVISSLKESEVYFSKEGVVFIIETNYATGGYALLELLYDLTVESY
jgi:hypothetical protein